MKKYITPATRWAEIEEEAIIAGSNGGLNDGDSVNNQKAAADNDDNFFSREVSSSSLWDKEW